MAVNSQSRTVWKYKLAEEFVVVRTALSEEKFNGRLERPLRDWTVLDDRPLPVCFFDTSVRTLINASFTSLFSTPGVGQRKMAVLLRVLRRIAGIAEPATAPIQPAEDDEQAARRPSRAAVDLQATLAVRFRRVRQALLDSNRSDVLAQRLRYWATPADRRLPSILLDHSVAELLEMQIAAMCDAPYVGPKKISGLMDLLERAARDARSQPLASQASHQAPGGSTPANDNASDFAFHLTEETWRQWCAMVVDHGLTDEPLGRYAGSLGDLARVLWNVPLRKFTSLTLADLKLLDGPSPHRVRQVLGVFRDLNHLLKNMGPPPQHLATRILPRRATRLSAWASLVCDGRLAILPAELNRELVQPLIEQLNVDLGDRVARLADWLRRYFAAIEINEVQLGELHASLVIKQQYVLHEAQMALALRWPEGLSWMLRLRESAERSLSSVAAIQAIDTLIQLLFESPASEFGAEPANHVAALAHSPRRWMADGYRGPASPLASDRAASTRWPQSRAADNNRTAPRNRQ